MQGINEWENRGEGSVSLRSASKPRERDEQMKWRSESSKGEQSAGEELEKLGRNIAVPCRWSCCLKFGLDAGSTV